MLNVRLALDTAPTTLHSGFLIAQAKGWYQEADITLTLLDPTLDNYYTSPLKKLLNNEANLALAPSEGIISYQHLREPKPMVAIASVLQQNPFSLATFQTSGLSRPANLDGKVYGSHGARFESPVVQQLIRNDGGYGFIRTTPTTPLVLRDEFAAGHFHFARINRIWDGLHFELSGRALHYFSPEDYDIPYGYCPVLGAMSPTLDEYQIEITQFLAITKYAFEWCCKHPEEAADILSKKGLASEKNPALILKSLTVLPEYMLDPSGEWGIMEESRWINYLEWMNHNSIIKDMDYQFTIAGDYAPSNYFTNDYGNIGHRLTL